MMYDSLSPSLRGVLVHARCTAIAGRMEDAFNLLHDALAKGVVRSPLDNVALWMLKAELLHLDFQDSEALEMFGAHVMPTIAALPDEAAVIIGFNRADVSMALFQPTDFYEVVDHSRVAGVELWRNESLFYAQKSAAKGEHFKSLPAILRELNRAYVQGCWAPYRAACGHMSRQCLQLGWGAEAAFHAVNSLDTNMAQDVGKHLLGRGTNEIVTNAIDTLLQISSLRRLFVTACSAIRPMVDAIPEVAIERIFCWLLSRAAESPTSVGGRRTMETAWETLEELAFRLDDDQANRLASCAIAHTWWQYVPLASNEVVPVRRTMLRAISRATGTMSARTAGRIALEVSVVATQRKQNHDYTDAIEALCQLATRGGKRVKAQLRNILYPKGQPLNSVLVEVAGVFGVTFNDASRLRDRCGPIAENIRLQVQRLAEGEASKSVAGAIFTINKKVAEVSLVVSAVQLIDAAAILRHRGVSPPRVLRKVIDAMLDMIREPENVLTNKTTMAELLSTVGDVCSIATARRIVDVLAPLARGEIVEPTCTMSAAEAANTLNPFKFGSGDPNELRGVALLTIACIARDQGAPFTGQAIRLIELAIQDVDAVVRCMGLAAARELPRASSSLTMGALLATRDHDPSVANAAFGAVVAAFSGEQDEMAWRLLLQSLHLALKSPEVLVRRAAAYAAANVNCLGPKGANRLELAAVLDEFGRDRCHSVRRESRGRPK